jgi:hypothetical protein
LVVNNFDHSLSFIRGESSSIQFSLANIGEADVNWKVNGVNGIQLFNKIHYMVSSPFYGKIEELITENGGIVEELSSSFFESDLLGIHVIVMEDRISKYDSIQITYLQKWVALGGKLLTGLDSEEALDNANKLISPVGIQFNSYEEIHYSYLYDLPETHFLIREVSDLYLYFYKAYLSFSDGSSESVLLDEEGNHHVALTK